MMKNLSDAFIDLIDEVKNRDIPVSVLSQVKMLFLDYLGVTVAGAKEIREKNTLFLNQFHSDSFDCTVIGQGRKASLYNAVILNGLNSHVLELDDGHRKGMLHLGGSIITAVFSISEYYALSSTDFFKGVVVGYEAAIRIAMAMQPVHKLRGYHATGTCGTIGAALGVSAALRYTKEQLKAVLSVAITSAAGLLEIQEEQSELKPYNVGRAAFDGVAAALMGRSGFVGPDDPLCGKRGLLNTMSDFSQLNKLIDSVDYYHIEDVYLKSYASCRHSHPAIDATLNLRSRYSLKSEEIDRILIKTYEMAIIGHDHKNIPSISSAKMSTPFCVAIALKNGYLGLNEFCVENIRNKEVLNLMDRIQIEVDEELNVLATQKRAAIVEIYTKTKEVYKERIDNSKGEPENPLSRDDIEKKFASLMQFAEIPTNSVNKLRDLVWNIEDRFPEIFLLL